MALIGPGKIARDSHMPVITANETFHLAATASPQDQLAGVPRFADIDALLVDGPMIEAVAIFTPAGGALSHRHARYRCRTARAAGEAARRDVVAGGRSSTRAERRGITLFAAWHSR